MAGSTLAGTAVADEDDPEPSVTFEDQTSDGTSVVIARAAADVNALVVIENDDGEWVLWDRWKRLDLAAGETAEDVTLELEEPIAETQELTAVMFESNGPVIAQDTAVVTVEESDGEAGEDDAESDEDEPERLDGVDATFVEANPAAGFDAPYYLYAPDRPVDAEPTPFLVEPVAGSTDDREQRLSAAESTIADGTGRSIADELGAPLLVPALSHPLLDVEALTLEGSDSDSVPNPEPERVDRQLLRMLEDARARLVNRSYPVGDGLSMHGSAAAGLFVNRFTALHPERVASVTVGDTPGTAILPLELAAGYRLDYPLGVANFEELTGESFDLESFREVDQFFYAGVGDPNDTLPKADTWPDRTTEEFRERVRTVYGDDVRTERLPFCKAVYDDAGVDAVFRWYDDAERTAVVDDLVAFHERSLAGDDVADLRADLGGTVPHLGARIDHVPPNPTAGGEITFTAARSAVWERELVDFEWRFDDGDPTTNLTDREPVRGERVAHAFDTAGGYYVSLTVTDETGETHRTVELVYVDEEPGGRSEDGSDDVDDADADEAEAAAADADADDGEPAASETGHASASDPESEAGTAIDSVPGFGVGGTLAALGGLGYALRRRVGRTRDRE